MQNDFTRLIEGLRSGEPVAVRAFCDRYGDGLQRLADRNMASGLLQRVGSDDVLQSVYRTFFRRMADGQFALDDAGALWRLLCAITLTKVREQARFHTRQRRSFQADVPVDPQTPLTAERVTPPDEAAAFVELFEQVLASLSEDERAIVDLKLQDRSNAEIAGALGCSERTVRRMLAGVRVAFESHQVR